MPQKAFGDKTIWRLYNARFIESLLFLTAISSIVFMLLVFYYLADNGIQTFRSFGVIDLIFGHKWNPYNNLFGMMPLLVNTLLVTTLALFINMLIGIPLAIYLAEYASPGEKGILKPAIDLLNGVPSIIYGLLGVIILVPYLQDSFDMITGRSILAGGIVLGIMFIPFMATICEDALHNVPHEFKEGSMALGATKWQTIRNITLPAASSGISSAIILNVGNIVGETMAVLLVVGNIPKIPTPVVDIFDRGATFTSIIAGQMGEAAAGSHHFHSLFAVGLILLVLVTILSVIADQINIRIKKRFGGY